MITIQIVESESYNQGILILFRLTIMQNVTFSSSSIYPPPDPNKFQDLTTLLQPHTHPTSQKEEKGKPSLSLVVCSAIIDICKIKGFTKFLWFLSSSTIYLFWCLNLIFFLRFLFTSILNLNVHFLFQPNEDESNNRIRKPMLCVV